VNGPDSGVSVLTNSGASASDLKLTARTMSRLRIIIENGGVLMKRDFKPVHPGVILKEIIEELGITQTRLAHDIGVSPMRVSHIINGSRPVTGDIALRLGKYLRQTPQFWMNLQSNFDVQIAQESIGNRLKSIKPAA